MTIREAIKKYNIKFNGSKKSFLIGFGYGDETELDASSPEELEDLWMSLINEFEADFDSIGYIEPVYKKYKARVAFCGVWCNGTIDTYGDSPEDAYNAAIEDIGTTLCREYPDLDVEYSVEVIEEEE